MNDWELDLFNKKLASDLELLTHLENSVKSSTEVKNAVSITFKNDIRVILQCNMDVYNVIITYSPPEFGYIDTLYMNDDTSLTPMGIDRLNLYMRYLSSIQVMENLLDITT